MQLIFWFLCLLFSFAKGSKDTPCVSKKTNHSPVCVCNATYCDEIYAEGTLKSDNYRIYISNQRGKRFSKSIGKMTTMNKLTEFHLKVTLELDPTRQYQKLEGFGGAVTDSTGINWLKLQPDARKKLIESYFGENGLLYSFIRLAIGGTDFSTHPYAYNEYPTNDATLSNFTLSREDYEYKIPMLKLIKEVSVNKLKIVSSTWSPPTWMKTNNEITGNSRLKKAYYQTYADYHLKFIEEYKKEGFDIWGITTTNEPVNGIIPIFVGFNSLGFPPGQMTDWIVNNLGPTIRNSQYMDLKIFGIDDQRYTLPSWPALMVARNRTVLDWLDGFAVHFYSDFAVPAGLLNITHHLYPKHALLATEACTGSKPWDALKVDLGSWDRGVEYATSILDDLNNWVVGWIDWNLCLDLTGGPNWARNFVDSPIIISDDGSEFYKQPMYYVIGHFSKFIPIDSIRIELTQKSFLGVNHVAFLRPDGSYVVVLLNTSYYKKGLVLKIPSKNKEIEMTLDAQSISTVEIYV